MSKLKRLITINKLSQKNSKWKHRDIFRILNKNEIWIAAYEKLKGNGGAETRGSITETMDGMSLERLKGLQYRVCTEIYKFKPVKLIYIPAKKGKKRPLGLSTANDKIVQEVMRMILEAIYEPVFSSESFGFRTGLGCHDALAHVENKFRWVDHVIEGDIEQVYPTIDHHILVKILEKRIEDPRFIRLVWKFLRCGILDEELTFWSGTGVSQGSIVSPILANIYYHELDEFIQNIKETFETLKSDKKNLNSLASKSLRNKRLQTENLKEKIIRIEYVRYADEWMVGVLGDQSLAFKIKDEIADFMKNSLAQKLHPLKTKVSDLRKGNVHFLGYEIFLPRNRSISTYKGKGVKTIRRGQPQLRFDLPVANVTKRYIDRGYLKQLQTKVRPISKSSYTVLEDHVIVSHFRSLWLGLLNYYSGCTNRGRLQYIHYLLHMSCAMTLAHRHRISCSKVFKKHGKFLKVKIPNTDRTVSFSYKTSWKLSERRWLKGQMVQRPTHHYANLVAQSALGLPCAICDSEEYPIEMHHVKHVKKQGFRYQGFRQQMLILNRNQIPMCKNCHRKVHEEFYAGTSLSELRIFMKKRMSS